MAKLIKILNFQTFIQTPFQTSPVINHFITFGLCPHKILSHEIPYY